MTIYTKTLLIIFIVTFSVFFLVTGITKQQNDQFIKLYVNLKDEAISSFYKEFTESFSLSLRSFALNIINDDDVVESFKNKDFEKTLYFTKKYHKSIQDYFQSDITMHFHLPEGHSFLRVHAPAKNGDNLLDIRESIKKINSDHKAFFCYELGKKGLFYRYLTPVFNEGNFIGTFEIGIPVQFFMSRMQSLHGIYTSVLLKDDSIAAAFLKNYKTTTDGYTEIENNSSAFTLFYQKYNKTPLGECVDINNKHFQHRDNFPIVGAFGEEIGHFVFLFETTRAHSLLNKYTIAILLTGLVLLISVIAITKVGFLRSIQELEEDHKKLYQELEAHNKTLKAKIEIELAKNNRQQAQIEYQKRLAEMGEMLSAISHHWRQPLNAVGLYIQDLKESYTHNELNDKYINQFTADTLGLITNLSDSIEDFHAISKHNNTPKPFVVLSELSEISKLMSSYIKANDIKFIYSCNCTSDSFRSEDIITLPQCNFNDVLVKGDSKTFKHSIIAILQNSIHAIKNRRSSGLLDKGIIHIELRKDENSLNIKFKDNGGGFESENIEKIFNPYFTTKSIGEGTGLGLYMAKICVEEQLKGRITAYNENAGAVIDINLPLQVTIDNK